MRVLLVTHYFAEHRGGVEIVAGELAQRIVDRHADVEITWLAAGRSTLADAGRLRRVRVRAWNVTERRLGFPYPVWSPAALWRLARHVRDSDIVHVHDSLYLGNVVASLWARRYGKPVVVTQHIGPVPYSSRVLRGLLGLANRTIARVVLAGCNQAVFISPRIQAYFGGLVRFRNPPIYLANGVDAQRFFPVSELARVAIRARLGFPPERKVRLFVGRFVEKKGLPLLRHLAADRPDDLWVFVGWGADEPAEWGLQNVRSAGALRQDDIADYYRAADLLVLPSVGEGFPLVVQEAMACGLQVLTSPETLQGGPEGVGMIASAELDPARWSNGIDRLDAVPDASDRRRLVAAFALRWNWDDVADRYVDLFRAALNR
jgi:glycosyltransferase involved in cell wall biosynthesis